MYSLNSKMYRIMRIKEARRRLYMFRNLHPYMLDKDEKEEKEMLLDIVKKYRWWKFWMW